MGFRDLVFTISTPINIIKNHNRYMGLKISPSIIPQIIATIGIIYVTDDAKIGLLIFISLLKAINAIPVPAMANMLT